eukprot:CAMPEP_0172720522 /NCGR_PEP_ID=MMETSP1074-20121228/77076_1 /TAXON_ID=2916 /ORGANISM="Ceratium fusus, Strain PA161109" /LENGTH=709 /DNA_ID=CAMNT_0013546051 /DNA_START=154 /DNA_END=2283 /DNA_ORIENTATION=-
MRALLLSALLLINPLPSTPLKLTAMLATHADDDASSDGSPTHNKRIAAVNETLTDILLSIEAEERSEAANYLRYMRWCESETTDLAGSVSRLQREKEKLEVSKKEGEALIAKLEHTVKSISKQMSVTRDEMAQAAALKDGDDGEADADLKLNRQSIAQVTNAIKIVQKVNKRGGFLQNGAIKRLQLNEPGESSYVLGIMKQLKKGLTKTRKELLKAQAAKDKGDKDLWRTKNAQYSLLESQIADKRSDRAKAAVDLVEVKRLLKVAVEKLPKEMAKLADTQDKCSKKQSSWKVRGHDRAMERSAIREAIAYLVQTSKYLEKKVVKLYAEKRESDKDDDKDDDGSSLVQAQDMPTMASFLQVDQQQSAASTSQTSALLANVLRGRMNGVNLGAVKNIVQKMITTLLKQQKDEGDTLKYCESSLEKTDDEKSEAEDGLKTLVAGITLQESQVKSLQKEIDDLNAALAKQKKLVDEATVIRKKEKIDYDKGTRDRLLAGKVLKQATAVLAKFYASMDPSQAAALNQGPVKIKEKMKKPPKTWREGTTTRKEIMGNAVIRLLEKIMDDIKLEQKAAQKDEEKAVVDYEKLVQDTKENFDNSMSDITERMKRKAKITVEVNADKQSKSQKDKELIDVKKQLASLHAKCDELIKNFEARTKARNFEVSQLRDVMDIVSGSSVAVRTGLLEQPAQQEQQQAQAAASTGAGQTSAAE